MKDKLLTILKVAISLGLIAYIFVSFPDIDWGAVLAEFRFWPWLLTRPAERFAAEAARVAPEVEVRVLAPLESTGLR